MALRMERQVRGGCRALLGWPTHAAQGQPTPPPPHPSSRSNRPCAQAANAARIAEWLDAHPLVQRVNYPGLPQHPGRDVHLRQVAACASVCGWRPC